MKYNELVISKYQKKNRVGRGIAAGQGKTAGRGTKGQKSRTGSKKNPGFAGGQTPIMQRLPKLHGFHSHKVKAEVVTTVQLQELKQTTVTNEVLAAAGLISSPFVIVKLLDREGLTRKIAVKTQNASVQAVKTIEKAGGSFEKVPQIKRIAKKQTEKVTK